LAQLRFIMIRSLEAATRDAQVCGRLVPLLEDRIAGSDTLDANMRTDGGGESVTSRTRGDACASSSRGCCASTEPRSMRRTA
jgi:hypothetical protein